MTIEELKQRHADLANANAKLEEIAYKKEKEKFDILAKQFKELIPQINDMLNLWLDVYGLVRVEPYPEIIFPFVNGRDLWVKNCSIALNTCAFEKETGQLNSVKNVPGKPDYGRINISLKYFLDHFEEAKSQ